MRKVSAHSGSFEPNSFQISKYQTEFGLHYSHPVSEIAGVSKEAKLHGKYDV